MRPFSLVSLCSCICLSFRLKTFTYLHFISFIFIKNFKGTTNQDMDSLRRLNFKSIKRTLICTAQWRLNQRLIFRQLAPQFHRCSRGSRVSVKRENTRLERGGDIRCDPRETHHGCCTRRTEGSQGLQLKRLHLTMSTIGTRGSNCERGVYVSRVAARGHVFTG